MGSRSARKQMRGLQRKQEMFTLGWQWPTLPRRFQRSTIGACGLNDRVRHGTGCTPAALTTNHNKSHSLFNSHLPRQRLSLTPTHPLRRSWLSQMNLSNKPLHSSQNSLASHTSSNKCLHLRSTLLVPYNIKPSTISTG